MAESQPLELTEFFEALLTHEPFAVNRIADPTQLACDVATIHQAAFERLTTLAEETQRQGSGKGALLLGGAGVGKSHMLARLSLWAQEQQRACLIFLHNIQVAPDDLGRYLLKCCVAKLAEDRLERLHDTPLFRLVSRSIKDAAAKARIKHLTQATQEQLFRQLVQESGADEATCDIVFLFYCAVRMANEKPDPEQRYAELAALAVRWLQGDVLDADEARRLKRLPRPGEEVVQLDEPQIERAILSIARLAAQSQQPFILCIDQVDNMKAEQLRALGQTLHALIDHASNLLVVVSGVREPMRQFLHDGVLTEAAADRLDAKHPVELRRLSRGEAREILRGRLSGVLQRFSALPEVAARWLPTDAADSAGERDPLFPLGTAWFERQEPDSLEIRPRDAITWAQDRWRTIQHEIRELGGAAWLANWRGQQAPHAIRELTPAEVTAAIDQKIAQKLEESLNKRRLDPGSLPPDAGNLLGLTKELLGHCLNRPGEYTLERIATVAPTQYAELEVHETRREDGRQIVNRVIFVTTGSATSAAAQLRRLIGATDVDHRILVTDNARRPLHLAARGREYLQELEQLGGGRFTHVALTFDQYAELDALQAVVQEARSGDLEIELGAGRSHRISEAEVTASHHRFDRYRLHALLRPFLTEEPPAQIRTADFPPEADFRAFVTQHLAPPGAISANELARRFLAGRHTPPVEECLRHAKGILLRMHAERLLTATPCDDDLLLATREQQASGE